MRELHAALLRLAEPGEADRARQLVWALLRRLLPEFPAEVDRRRGAWRTPPGSSRSDEVRWSTVEAGGESLHEVAWWRPARTDPSLLARTTVVVGAETDAAWVVLRTGLESVGSTILEVAELPPEPAPLVPHLLTRLRCVDAGRRLRVEAEPFGVDRALELAAFVTATPSRALPVLVVDTDGRDPPPGDVGRVGVLLGGIAHVVTVDPPAAGALARELGPAFAVPEGGARILWPRWRSDDPPGRHRAFDRAEVAAGGPRPRFPGSVAGVLRLAAVTRVTEPPELRYRLRAAEAARRAEQDREQLEARARERSRDRAPGGATTPAVAAPTPDPGRDELLELYDAVLADRDAELEQARSEIEELSRQLRHAKDDLDRAILGLAQGAPGAAAPPASPGGDGPPASLREAVERADARSAATVYVRSAYDSAAQAHSRDPARVLERLLVLDQVARRWHDGTLAGVPLGDAMRDAGLDWAAGISRTAQRKRADDYRCAYRGEEVALGPHLRFGSGLRVYCHLDHERRVVVVGHVGAHLPGKRDR